MQDRRHRPGDVLDDYCPRERRITDHAIVAMIDDEIRRTRCGSCDAEHEYKDGKVPTPRRKTQPPALFTQVLDGMNGPVPPAPVPPAVPAAVIDAEPVMMAAAAETEPPGVAERPQPVQDLPADPDAPENQDSGENPERELEGGFRRSLIRATFPRPDGQAPPPRALPEFTIQSLQNRRNNNGQRHAGGPNTFRGGRRRPGGAGGGSQDNLGPMRFRDHGAQQGDRPQGQGQGGGRRRRGGKKNR